MEINLIQIASACIVLVSTLVPLYFMLCIKAERQRLLSVILFIVLQAYVVHSLIEAFGLLDSAFQVFIKVCFVVAAFGLMVSYSFFQIRAKHSLVGGIFGAAMLLAFAAWMTVELAEATTMFDNESIESIGSVVMAGFAVFIIARYFWLRSTVLLEAREQL